MTIKVTPSTRRSPGEQIPASILGWWASSPECWECFRDFRRRVAQGDLGSLPIVAGLVVVWAYFQYSNSNFLTPGNLTNLMLQIAAVGTIAVGVVLVLLLGEIDLSVGAVSGLVGSGHGRS